jgi:hypothetical protein
MVVVKRDTMASDRRVMVIKGSPELALLERRQRSTTQSSKGVEGVYFAVVDNARVPH